MSSVDVGLQRCAFLLLSLPCHPVLTSFPVESRIALSGARPAERNSNGSSTGAPPPTSSFPFIAERINRRARHSPSARATRNGLGLTERRLRRWRQREEEKRRGKMKWIAQPLLLCFR